MAATAQTPQPMAAKVWYYTTTGGQRKLSYGILAYTTDGVLSLTDQLSTSVVWRASVLPPNKFVVQVTQIKGLQVDGVDYQHDSKNPNPYHVYFYNPRQFNPLTFPQVRAMFQAKPWKKVLEAAARSN